MVVSGGRYLVSSREYRDLVVRYLHSFVSQPIPGILSLLEVSILKFFSSFLSSFLPNLISHAKEIEVSPSNTIWTAKIPTLGQYAYIYLHSYQLIRSS